MKICKNCATEFKGKYCSQCGQKAITGRITTRDLFRDVIKKYLPYDKGFLFTAREALTRPGWMVRDYLDGKRVNYTKPLNFMLVLTATSLIFFPQAEFVQGMQDGFQQGVQQGGPGANVAMSDDISQWVYSNISLIFAGMLPFLALTSKWFHRKADVNYAEHLVLNVYLMGGCTLVSLPFSAVAYASSTNLMTPGPAFYAYMTFYLCYFMWGYIQFFQPPNKVWGGVKALLTYLVGYFIYTMTIGIVAIIGMVIYKIIFKG